MTSAWELSGDTLTPGGMALMNTHRCEAQILSPILFQIGPADLLPSEEGQPGEIDVCYLVRNDSQNPVIPAGRAAHLVCPAPTLGGACLGYQSETTGCLRG
jgi:hypothetical protein